MAADLFAVKIEFRLPIWFSAYVYTLRFLQEVGILEIDEDAALHFIVSWSQYRVMPGGRWTYFDSNEKLPRDPPNLIVIIH